jgi:hypothetical protein
VVPEKAINTAENYDMMKEFLSLDLDSIYQYSLLKIYYSSESKHTS